MVKKDTDVPSYVMQKLNFYGELRPDAVLPYGSNEVKIVFDRREGREFAYVRCGSSRRIRQFSGEDRAQVVAAIVQGVFRGRRRGKRT